jgi:endonuclease/exonuclease/phosphatase family metal-dependent hydrolase
MAPATGRAALLGAALLATVTFAVAVGCRGDGSSGIELLVVDQNILHGISDEDPEADPYDRFPERAQLLALQLSSVGPDVVLLQEVLAEPGEGYPNLRQTVLDALGGDYSAVFGNFLGDPIDTAGLGQMTITRLRIVSSENRTVSAIRSVHHLALEAEPGLTVHVYNAHLEGTGAVLETGEPAELAEIENVIAFIEETRGDGPVILAGDLNAEPDDPSIQRLVQEGFVDVLAEAGDATCEQAGDPGCTNSTIPLGDNREKLADHRIDYIFVRDGSAATIELSDAKLFAGQPIDIGEGRTLWLSDHIGVQARLTISRE